MLHPRDNSQIPWLKGIQCGIFWKFCFRPQVWHSLLRGKGEELRSWKPLSYPKKKDIIKIVVELINKKNLIYLSTYNVIAIFHMVLQ